MGPLEHSKTICFFHFSEGDGKLLEYLEQTHNLRENNCKVTDILSSLHFLNDCIVCTTRNANMGPEESGKEQGLVPMFSVPGIEG